MGDSLPLPRGGESDAAQVECIAMLAGLDLTEADQVCRALAATASPSETHGWFVSRSLRLGFPLPVVERVWAAPAAAALEGSTSPSGWLRSHWPADVLADVLDHEPRGRPARLVLADARRLGVAILGLDVNASGSRYCGQPVGARSGGRDRGIRVPLSTVRGITAEEVAGVVAARPFGSLADFWRRVHVSRPIVERLVLVGAFDASHGCGPTDDGARARGRVTRRDLLLQVADLDRRSRAGGRSGAPARGAGHPAALLGSGSGRGSTARAEADAAAARNSTDPARRSAATAPERHALGVAGVWAQTTTRSRAEPPRPTVTSVQLALDLEDHPVVCESALPELTVAEAVEAELEILGLDVSRHVIETYAPFLDELGVVSSRDLPSRHDRDELLVAGVVVPTRSPARSRGGALLLTVDDATGPVEVVLCDAQGRWAATALDSRLLVLRGELGRTAPGGGRVQATACWELSALHALWCRDGMAAVVDRMTTSRHAAGAPGPPDVRRAAERAPGRRSAGSPA